jgi:N-methylhydantoinase B
MAIFYKKSIYLHHLLQALPGRVIAGAGMDAIELSVFASRIAATCEEMGAVLRRAAFSPNIKDRLDFSCAVFDAQGQLCAQAAHIPVHLGSMAYAMRDLVAGTDWEPGDMLVVNDPFLGGTHLPDVTLVAPVFVNDQLAGFVANRAHHADIGAHSPGSMPVSRSLQEEGLVIPPLLLLKADEPVAATRDMIIGATANPPQMEGDLAAQISANRTGIRRLSGLGEAMGVRNFLQGLAEVNEYGARLASEALQEIPDGDYRFRDVMDDDGTGLHDIGIEVCIRIAGARIEVDFSGTAGQVSGNINCPLPVTAAGVYYVFRCLMPEHTPACAGSFRDIHIVAPVGCLLNARRPAAVAAGNVETSSRVVDVVMGALARALPGRIPAASQGTMNNLAMGARSVSRSWDYYETIAGGMGAGCRYEGLHATHSHMTNTLNTPIEVLEMNFPLRLLRYQLRDGSGGDGQHRGGDGLVREYEFLGPATVTLLTERRRHRPWGLDGGGAGASGENWISDRCLPAKTSLEINAGERLRICTPGGGGWGQHRDTAA